MKLTKLLLIFACIHFISNTYAQNGLLVTFGSQGKQFFSPTHIADAVQALLEFDPDGVHGSTLAVMCDGYSVVILEPGEFDCTTRVMDTIENVYALPFVGPGPFSRQACYEQIIQKAIMDYNL